MSYLERKVQEYWRAGTALSAPIVELAEHRQHKDKLWQLHRGGPTYRLRQNAKARLVVAGETIELKPGPFGGEAA